MPGAGNTKTFVVVTRERWGYSKVNTSMAKISSTVIETLQMPTFVTILIGFFLVEMATAFPNGPRPGGRRVDLPEIPCPECHHHLGNYSLKDRYPFSDLSPLCQIGRIPWRSIHWLIDK
ncbi:hypothetical protein MJO29_007531 [Puccinia striiformis f. sp. tritici]|nr:hypothetical protein MJO29_007531 [Puccinia striiformis f. sp. tritici]